MLINKEVEKIVTDRRLELNTLKMAVDVSPLANQAREALDSGDRTKSSMLRIQNIIILNGELEEIYEEMGIPIQSREPKPNINTAESGKHNE